MSKFYTVTHEDGTTVLVKELLKRDKLDDTWQFIDQNPNKCTSGRFMELEENIFNQTWEDEPQEVAIVKVVKPEVHGEPVVWQQTYITRCGCGYGLTENQKHCSECGAKLNW